ncbi:MAG TPA: hypothetical protein VIC28_18960 [Thermoanaerobaculia bacterium]|jgi:hypothetical protein
MRKPLAACLAIPLLAGAAAAFAGTVYVPVPDPVGSTGSSHALQVWVTNSGTAQRSYTATYLAVDTDGTKRSTKAAETPVQAGRTSLLGNIGAKGQVGLLEIDSSAEISMEARLTNTSPTGQITQSLVPTISSDNLFAAGEAAILQGLGRDGTRGDLSSIGIVNLAQQASQCTVKVFRAEGTQIGGTVTLAFKPLSLRYFADSFGLLGLVNLADARFQISCSQPFYAYANIFLKASSQLVFVAPSATGASTLTVPGGGGTSPPPAAGSVVYSIPGLFHTATTAKPKEQRSIVLERDLSLKRMVIEMDFIPGPWNLTKVPGNHGLIWLYRDKFRSNTIANVNAFSPPKLTLKAAQNIDLPATYSSLKEAGVPWVEGQRYHVKYTYDAEHGTVSVVLSSGGATVTSFSFEATATNHVLTVPAKGLTVDFGHYANQEGPEVAAYGWRYYDFRVEMVPY